MSKRHLHESYSQAYCGRDASHILMTYNAKEATCATCKRAEQAAKAAQKAG